MLLVTLLKLWNISIVIIYGKEKVGVKMPVTMYSPLHSPKAKIMIICQKD